MDAEPDAQADQKPVPAAALPEALPQSPKPSTSPVAADSVTAVTPEAPTKASASPVEASIKAASGKSPSPSAPPAAAAPAASDERRLSSSSATRRPLPGSAPSAALSSSVLPSRAQPGPSNASEKSDTSNQDIKMAVAEKEGKEEPDVKGSSNPSPTPRDSVSREASNGASKNTLEDEIVVGTKSNGIHSSPIHVVQEHEDVEMEDIKKSPEPPYPKRKRSSIYNELDEDKIERSLIGDDIETPPSGAGRQIKSAQSSPPPVVSQKHIVLGYWRDSTVPDAKDRHAVMGFIDSRDRLRTRIQQNSRSGKNVAIEYPLPPGPGGSWVTFERVVFDKHLVGLDHNQVKEYVKIRAENPTVDESPEDTATSEKTAVKEAIRRAALHPPADNLPPPQIAYGVDLPDYVVNAHRAEKKRRLGSSGTTFSVAPLTPSEMISTSNSQQHTTTTIAPNGSPSVASAIQRATIDLLPGTRPTKILLGFWRGSSEERVEDKHAVFGILGANDMFRVKVTRETRDGRPVLGNFPTGAGALWIHYDEVEFEKHIRHLSRPEVKEYVRVRQRQIDEGERPEHRADNEIKAVFEAQARVINAGGAAQSTLGTAGRVDTISFASAANLNREMNRQSENENPYQDGRSRREYPGHELRQTRRSYTSDSRDSAASSIAAAAVAAPPMVTRSGRHSLPDGSGLSANRQALTDQTNNNNIGDRVERTNSLARREIARVETIQMRNEQRAASREAGGVSGAATGVNSSSSAVQPVGANAMMNGTNGGSNGTSSRVAFNENIGRLNKVWASQEASRLRAGGEDAKIFMGVKYERKQTGPFQGKLVSPGTILSIDGEDYVEYRVLTKPTFF